MERANLFNPCVNNSVYETTVYGTDIYLGFMLLQNLESKISKLIPHERKQNGTYKSLEDFVNRIPIGIEGIQNLIFIGTFRFTGKNKNELLIQARLLSCTFKIIVRNQSLKFKTLFQFFIQKKYPRKFLTFLGTVTILFSLVLFIHHYSYY